MTRRKLAWLAVGCGFSAIVAVLVGTLGSISAFSLRTYEVAGEVEFQVGQAGTWVLACETRATVDGVEKSGRLILPARVHLTDPAGSSRELMPTNRSIRYSPPSRFLPAKHSSGLKRPAHNRMDKQRIWPLQIRLSYRLVLADFSCFLLCWCDHFFSLT